MLHTHTHTLTRRISRNDPGREEAGANKAGGPREDTQPTARVEMGMRRWLGNTDGAHLTGVTHAVATRVPTGRPYQCLRHITSDISVAHAP